MKYGFRMGTIVVLLAALGICTVFAAGQAHAAKENKAAKDAKVAEKAKKAKDWAPLFNGEDLTGWVAEGGADWKVEDGVLIGRQGTGNAPGDLFTAQEYADFELVVEYKITWPANSGIWFRYQAPDKSYQADILEYKDPECYSGTIYCPVKMFLSMNEDPDLEDREGWNTMKIRAVGDHLQVWLNGKKVGDVHEDSFDKGRIGFQIHAGDQFAPMEIAVRKAKIRVVGQ